MKVEKNGSCGCYGCNRMPRNAVQASESKHLPELSQNSKVENFHYGTFRVLKAANNLLSLVAI